MTTYNGYEIHPLEKIAKSIISAANEHGRPNSFGLRELYEFHGGATPMAVGRMLKNGSHRLTYDLHRLGWRGTFPIYDRETKRIYV